MLLETHLPTQMTGRAPPGFLDVEPQVPGKASKRNERNQVIPFPTAPKQITCTWAEVEKHGLYN